ncbi:MAG: transglutaminase family protein [Burkholderiales bacterium]|nr:transglutaminase family protein [Phycisphaerae bacterium]
MMKPVLPLCCSNTAFRLFSEQAAKIETTDGLLKASVAVAMHQLEDVKITDVTRQINGYAKMIRSRVHGPQQQAWLAHLHQYLFEDLGYAGNSEDYYAPSNSYLPEVVETRRGLPISLALVYKAAAEKIGLTVHGVGLPGHFISALETERGTLYIDCFAGGRTMTKEECRHRVESIFSDTVEWNDQMLRPVTHRMWLSRMIQNLLHIFTTNQQWADVAAMLEFQMMLWPKQAQLQRDLALVLARIDMPKPACMWLGEYLRSNPNDPERDELTSLLSKLSR